MPTNDGKPDAPSGGSVGNTTNQGNTAGSANASQEFADSASQSEVNAPKTNDNAPLAAAIMLLMAGVLAMAGVVGKKRKLG
ncbi:MAG: LPXTG cell wall anchor domain-containing protein [Roseburia sp.]|nr:LPXTG cell wall anchor domain-containing protein [Roseburia sp.]